MLVQVEDVKTSFKVFVGVTNFEKKPLRISIRIDVILKEEVVLVVCYLWNQRKISWLESWFKDQCFIQLVLSFVKGFYLLILGLLLIITLFRLS